MQDKSYWFFYVFVECMVYNNRSFCEDDFKALLESQRLSKIKMNFNDEVKDFVDECKILDDIDYELNKNNYWMPKNNILNHDYNLKTIIQDLRLDLELEHANNDFYDSSCDIVQKINNYLHFL